MMINRPTLRNTTASSRRTSVGYGLNGVGGGVGRCVGSDVGLEVGAHVGWLGAGVEVGGGVGT